jgi:hypothetical protein
MSEGANHAFVLGKFAFQWSHKSLRSFQLGRYTNEVTNSCFQMHLQTEIFFANITLGIKNE